MANSARTQQALAVDPTFLLRVRNAATLVAADVLTESPQPPNYAARAAYARLVAGNLDTYVQVIASWLVVRTNVNSFATSWDPDAGGVSGAIVTASGDSDIFAQLTADWDFLAGA